MNEQNDTCEILSDTSIFIQIQSYIKEVYPDYSSEDVLKDKMPIIEKSECICKDLNDIYCEREKYSLHWAFKQASESVIIRQQKLSEKLIEIIPDYQEIVTSASKSTKLRVKQIRNIFNTLSFLVSFVDIVVSVGLILLVTFLAQEIESHIDSLILNIVVIGFIALLKVTLDRFLIMPAVDRWGWRQYLKAINLMKDISIKLLSMGFVLNYVVNQNENRDTLIELFLRNFEKSRMLPRTRRNLEGLLNNYHKPVENIQV